MSNNKNEQIQKKNTIITPKQGASTQNAEKITAFTPKSTPKKTSTNKKPLSKSKKKKRGNKRSPTLHKFFVYLEKNFSAPILITIVSLLIVAIFLIGIIVGVNIREKLEEKRDIAAYIQNASREFDVPYDVIYAIIETESDFDPDAVSSTGARGLMQINKITLQDINENLKTDYSMNDLFDPEINIKLGASYLARLYKRFGNFETVYAAYNAGPTKVSEWLKDSEYSNDGKTLIREKIPYSETKRYVEKVIAFRESYLASQD